jgi:spore maturation protein SpmB
MKKYQYFRILGGLLDSHLYKFHVNHIEKLGLKSLYKILEATIQNLNESRKEIIGYIFAMVDQQKLGHAYPVSVTSQR